MKILHMFCLLAVGASVPAAFGTVEATWKTDSGSIQQYTTLANWQERSSGAAITVAPTNAGDVAWFDLATNYWQQISLPSTVKAKGNNQMGTIHGTWHTRLLTCSDGSNGFAYYNYVFNDLSDFQGTLYPNRTGASLIFTGKTSDVHVADLAVRLRPTVSVPAGTTVTIDALHHPGALNTAGSGTIKLAESGLAGSQIVYHNAGTLELAGHTDGVVSVPGDPVLWVDASQTNTMTLAEPDENGRRFITDWYDCRRADGIHTKSATWTTYSWSKDVGNPGFLIRMRVRTVIRLSISVPCRRFRMWGARMSSCRARLRSTVRVRRSTMILAPMRRSSSSFGATPRMTGTTSGRSSSGRTE